MANTLRTGLVIAGGYADKVRRVLFAQLKDKIKSGELTNTDVARAAAELNRLLFEIIVNRLQLDKGDVVRVTIEYEIEPPEVKWKLETLQIQAWRRIPDEEVEAKVRQALVGAEEYMTRVELEARKLGETDTGDVVYELLFQGRRSGVLLVTPLDGTAVVRGAITEPSPMVIKRTTIDYEGDLDKFIAASINSLLEKAANTELRDAQKIIREILAMLGEEYEYYQEEA